MDLYSLTLHALRELIIKKEITAKDAAFAYTRRIGQLEGSVNAYLTLTPNKTIAMADDADHALSKGKTCSASRHTPGHKRQHVHEGGQNYLRLEDARGLRPAVRVNRYE